MECKRLPAAGRPSGQPAVATKVREDRRAALREVAARVRESLAPAFRRLGADEIMAFLRDDEPAKTRRVAAKAPAARRGSRR